MVTTEQMDDKLLKVRQILTNWSSGVQNSTHSVNSI